MNEFQPTSEIPSALFYGREGEPIVNVQVLSGAGVFGMLYLGRYQGEQENTVVIKVARPEPNREAAVVFEAILLQDLIDHGATHVPMVHSFHPEASSPYFTMDLATGDHPWEVSLKEGLGGRSEEKTSLEIVSQLAETLLIAERTGYAYSDWKSVIGGANLFWDGQRQHLTLIDWGASRIIDEARRRTVQDRLNILADGFKDRGKRDTARELSDYTQQETRQEDPEKLKKENLDLMPKQLYALLTVEHLSPFGQPEDHPAWQFITSGTQAILRKQYQNMEELVQDLKKELDRWRKPTPILLQNVTHPDLSLPDEVAADLAILHQKRNELSQAEQAQLSRARQALIEVFANAPAIEAGPRGMGVEDLGEVRSNLEGFARRVGVSPDEMLTLWKRAIKEEEV